MPATSNANGLLAKNRALRAALPASRQATLQLAARLMVSSLAANSPRDTNRYVGGWIKAGRGAGVPGVAPPIQPSKRRNAILSALVAQIAAVQQFVNIKDAELKAILTSKGNVRAVSKGAAGSKRYQRTAAQLASAKLRLQAAKDALTRYAGNEQALAIMRKYSYVLNGNQRHITGKALNIEVRDKVYGGEGQIVNGQDRSVLRLHNLEPYSTAVERKHHVLSVAKGAASGLALRPLRKKYIEQARRAWRLTPKKP